METPGTSAGLNELCVSTNILQKTREKNKEPVVNIMDEDESQLLSIFPEEIWLKVFGNVDRSSLESVNNASPFFRRLLYPDRQLFLFSSVWNILGLQYEVNSDPVYSDLELGDGDLNNSSEYDGLEKPTFPVILKLRLVCRDWCLAINKFYEDLYNNYDTRESVLRPRVESGFDSADEIANKPKYGRDMGGWSECELMRVATVQSFMRHFAATHDSQTNPFPFRKVIFDSGSYLVNYLTEAVVLLKKYGHHIWFCEFRILGCSQDLNSEECYVKFREMLTLMPNLKVLRLFLEHFRFSFNRPGLREILATHPIPKFENLTFVSFTFTSRLLMENLLDNNPQVTKIEIYGLNDFNLATVALPNLTHLAVLLKSMDEFEMLENCGRLWRLEMLHMTTGFQMTVSINPRIFACLEQWKDSLQDVVVSLPYAGRDEDKAEIVRNFGIRLDLPHVKRLRLGMRNIMSLDLILPMKNSLEVLEYWNIARWAHEEWEAIPKQLLDEMKTKEVIQFRPAHNFNMYNSNIWTLFPKLRRIHVENEMKSCAEWFRNGPAFIREKLKTSAVSQARQQ